MKAFLVVFATVATMLVFSSPAFAATYTFASSINDQGNIVGSYEDSAGIHGFIDVSGIFTTIDDPAGVGGTVVYGINDSNDIVGRYAVPGFVPNPYGSSNQIVNGFVYSSGVFSNIIYPASLPNEYITFANGIGNNGIIVGNYTQTGSGIRAGFVYNGGLFSAISEPWADNIVAQSINDSGIIVGYYQDGSGYHGYSDDSGVFSIVNFPGSTETLAYGINAAGWIVGVYDSGIGEHGFLDESGSFTTINYPTATPDGCGTLPTGINNQGVVVGTYCDNLGEHGFEYQNGIYTTVDDPLGIVADPPIGAAVPEPATWATILIGVGMVGGGLRMARRKNNLVPIAA